MEEGTTVEVDGVQVCWMATDSGAMAHVHVIEMIKLSWFMRWITGAASTYRTVWKSRERPTAVVLRMSHDEHMQWFRETAAEYKTYLQEHVNCERTS